MRSTIIISKRGEGYIADVTGRFGGGHRGGRVGLSAGDAAIKAAQLMVQYAQTNPEGGDLVAPDEILSRVPRHLHSIAAKQEQ